MILSPGDKDDPLINSGSHNQDCQKRFLRRFSESRKQEAQGLHCSPEKQFQSKTHLRKSIIIP